jgi:hypothetical protein
MGPPSTASSSKSVGKQRWSDSAVPDMRGSIKHVMRFEKQQRYSWHSSVLTLVKSHGGLSCGCASQETASSNQDASMAVDDANLDALMVGHGGVNMGPMLSGRGPWAPEGLQGQQLRKYFADQLMQPEWMSDIPPDLGTSW